MTCVTQHALLLFGTFTNKIAVFYLFKHGRVWMWSSHTVSDEALGGCFDLPGDNPTSIYYVLPVNGLGQLGPLLLAGLPEPRARKPEIEKVCTPFLTQEVSEQLDAFLVI